MPFGSDGHGTFAEAKAKGEIPAKRNPQEAAAAAQLGRRRRRTAWIEKHTPELAGEYLPYALGSLEVLEVLGDEPVTAAAVRERTKRKVAGFDGPGGLR